MATRPCAVLNGAQAWFKACRFLLERIQALGISAPEPVMKPGVTRKQPLALVAVRTRMIAHALLERNASPFVGL